MGEKEVRSEIERYSSCRAQAFAYKVGMQKITGAARESGYGAGQTLIIAIHDVVLKNGALPARILDEKSTFTSRLKTNMSGNHALRAVSDDFSLDANCNRNVVQQSIKCEKY